jgi:hypothetical protein
VCGEDGHVDRRAGQPTRLWCTAAVKIRIVALVIVVLASAACSSPPGPAPGTPAPTLPEDAIAYDDLLSTVRPFPFTNSCEQLTTESIAEAGARSAHDLRGMSGPVGCVVEFGAPELDEVWIEGLGPPNPSEPRYFPLVWNGELRSTSYHRRFLLDGRYYAVETIDFLGSQPGCYLTVDTGSPSAVQFRGVLPEQHAASYGELNYAFTGYDVDHAGVDRFMRENCPVVEDAAIAMLAAIDPGGGSLVTG